MLVASPTAYRSIGRHLGGRLHVEAPDGAVVVHGHELVHARRDGDVDQVERRRSDVGGGRARAPSPQPTVPAADDDPVVDGGDPGDLGGRDRLVVHLRAVESEGRQSIGQRDHHRLRAGERDQVRRHEVGDRDAAAEHGGVEVPDAHRLTSGRRLVEHGQVPSVRRPDHAHHGGPVGQSHVDRAGRATPAGSPHLDRRPLAADRDGHGAVGGDGDGAERPVCRRLDERLGRRPVDREAADVSGAAGDEVARRRELQRRVAVGGDVERGDQGGGVEIPDLERTVDGREGGPRPVRRQRQQHRKALAEHDRLVAAASAATRRSSWRRRCGRRPGRSGRPGPARRRSGGRPPAARDRRRAAAASEPSGTPAGPDTERSGWAGVVRRAAGDDQAGHGEEGGGPCTALHRWDPASADAANGERQGYRPSCCPPVAVGAYGRDDADHGHRPRRVQRHGPRTGVALVGRPARARTGPPRGVAAGRGAVRVGAHQRRHDHRPVPGRAQRRERRPHRHHRRGRRPRRRWRPAVASTSCAARSRCSAPAASDRASTSGTRTATSSSCARTRQLTP